jgi:hypothetical protein
MVGENAAPQFSEYREAPQLFTWMMLQESHRD